MKASVFFSEFKIKSHHNVFLTLKSASARPHLCPGLPGGLGLRGHGPLELDGKAHVLAAIGVDDHVTKCVGRLLKYSLKNSGMGGDKFLRVEVKGPPLLPPFRGGACLFCFFQPPAHFIFDKKSQFWKTFPFFF